MEAKALIITASIGSGHTRAAEAVRSALLGGRHVSQATVADFLDDRDTASRVIKDAYLKMLGVFPNAYDHLYRWSQSPVPGANLGSLTALLMRNKLLRLLEEHRPGIVVFTHPFPCCAAASLRGSRQLQLPTAAVLTDFAVHRLWVHREIDRYFVASREMKASLAALGINGERIYATGIPVAAGFATQPPRRGTGEEPSILVMGGGLGLGAVEEAVTNLAAVGGPLSITVVAGGNDALRRRITAVAEQSPHNIAVLGFTDRVHELMAGATLLITKPGALTCSEALATGTPLLLYGSLPGQEEENAAYLVRQGVAVKADDAASLSLSVTRMLAKPELLAGMRSRALVLGRPNAAAEIAATIGGCLIARRANPAG
ncbi:MGDG synthase family glycosyltransferase [Anaeroselena agilis]|uniref:Glycosyltransferase n=1 Tax=Anaeroselena agilis TaxID=3063788 RepID=A0ABU3NZD1_9FIRM|nr:glycosyltransferase [Selenomonadales bacterium 4137-cl]